MTARKCICLRFDEHYDETTDVPAWVVSLDDGDEQSQLQRWSLDENDDETQHVLALDWAEKEAARRSLPLYMDRGDGQRTLIAAANGERK
jgi:hypothetical protein